MAGYGQRYYSPRVRTVVAIAGRSVHIKWDDGRKEDIDLAPLLFNNRIFVRLRTDDALFETVAVYDAGQGLKWADGSRLPTSLIIRLPASRMSGSELRSAMADLGLTNDALASMLGISRRTLANCRGSDLIPKVIALAVQQVYSRWGRE